MQQKILFIFLLVSILCCSEDEYNQLTDSTYRECPAVANGQDQPKYHLILIIGQSNTHAGIGFDSLIDSADKRVKQLGRFGEKNYKVVDAIEPLDHHTAQQDKIGFALTFANLYAESYLQEGDSVILIPCGFGGTGFSNNQWNKGDPLYEDAVERSLYLVDKYNESEISAILWHQGETDVGNMNYESLLTSFIQNLRADLKSPNVPFILGGMVPYWVEKDSQRILQQNIISRIKHNIPRTDYADPNTPFIIKKEDNDFDVIHFDADGQREMGKRYLNSFNCILNE